VGAGLMQEKAKRMGRAFAAGISHLANDFAANSSAAPFPEFNKIHDPAAQHVYLVPWLTSEHSPEVATIAFREDYGALVKFFIRRNDPGRSHGGVPFESKVFIILLKSHYEIASLRLQGHGRAFRHCDEPKATRQCQLA
jgi:hypothetical protein